MKKKVKNLKFESSDARYIIGGILGCVLVASPIPYLCYSNNTQICDEYSTDEDGDIFQDENGNYYKEFDVGEHIIKISRNDTTFHEYKAVEGYTIRNVRIAGWRDNASVEYINIEPIVAYGKKKLNGNIVFEEFGTVQKEHKIM